MTNQTPIQIPTRKEKLKCLMQEMSKGLYEREEQIKLLLLAALAGEHVLLIGPPGTAKSELAKRLKSVFIEANYFERLLTRFSVPEELYGPLSIHALEQDQYKRLTSGYLPETSVAFIDEIFKANSAILNSLLTLLNEREFDNGNRRIKVPLISVVAASNELPEGEELNALYDRFMLRSFVGPVSDASFEGLLNLTVEKCNPDLEIRLKVEDLNEVQQLSEKVSLSPAVIELCKHFKTYLDQENIYVSDRRWRKVVKLMKVSAFTSGQSDVSTYDAWILPHCLWNKPEQLVGLQEVYQSAVAISGSFSSENISKMIIIWEQRIQDEKKEVKQKRNKQGAPLFVNEKGKEVLKSKGKIQKRNRDGELLYWDRHDSETTESSGYYSNEKNKPCMEEIYYDIAIEPLAYSESHIQGRINEVSNLKEKINSHLDDLQLQLSSATTVINSHLWLDTSVLPNVATSIDNAITHTNGLLKRVDKIIKGFDSLPREKPYSLDDVTTELTEGVIEGELCE